MGQQRIMRQLARWHVWLGWLVGVPILIWTISGLVMVARPIEEVRGEHLRAAPPAIAPEGLVLPRLTAPVRSVELVRQPAGPAWIVTEADGGRFRYSASEGGVIAPVTEREAQEIAMRAFSGTAPLENVTYLPADLAPIDLRFATASWQARFADGTHLYIEDATGEVLAIRTRWWRIFDFAWGLHIMDLQTREDTSHPVLIIFAVLATIGSLLGFTLLFRRRKAARQGIGAP
jgi:hypothetical protein